MPHTIHATIDGHGMLVAAKKIFSQDLGHCKLDFSFPSIARPFLGGPHNFAIIVPGSPLFATWQNRSCSERRLKSFLMHALLLVQVGMLLVNVCVHDTCCSKSLLCWTILQSDDGLTLAKFYETVSIIYLY